MRRLTHYVHTTLDMFLCRHEHPSDMWLSTLEISMAQLCFITEFAQKSPFLCVNRFSRIQKKLSAIKWRNPNANKRIQMIRETRFNCPVDIHFVSLFFDWLRCLTINFFKQSSLWEHECCADIKCTWLWEDYQVCVSQSESKTTRDTREF